jgi:phosphatidylglycerol:prolipoprotein diacylglycerol transferase
VYPTLVRIGGFEVTTFGAMVALGALAALWVLGRETRASGLPPGRVDAPVWGLLAGLLGAKLLFVAEHVGRDSLARLVLGRGGLSWFGGLAGGLLAGLLAARRRRLPLVPLLAAAAPALAVGQAIGRIGCFLVGDDYGRPTALPWGVAFPRGLPPTLERVHPTQLYEALFLAGLAALLVRRRRRGGTDAGILATYLVGAGSARFAIEFLRLNVRVALGLTVAQWASLLLVLAGLLLFAWPARSRATGGRPAPPAREDAARSIPRA